MLNKNLKILAQTQPALADYLKKCSKPKDATLLQGDIRKVEKCSVLVMLGAGKVPKLPKEIVSVILVEPNFSQLRLFMEETDISSTFANREFQVVATGDNKFINNFFYTFFSAEQRLAICESHGFFMREGIEQEEFKFFVQVKQTCLSAIAQAITTYSGSKDHFMMGFRHYLYNSNMMHIDYLKLKDSCKDVPAVILSGGPSLNKDLPALKEFPGVVIALDAPYMGLIDNEVEIDYVTMMDREERLVKFFEKYDKKHVLVGIPEITDKVTSLFEPNVVLLPTLRRFYIDGLGYTNAFDGGTATTHLSFAWARFLGCNPIILCGQDFGITPEKKDHQYTDMVKYTEFSQKHFDEAKMKTVNRLSKPFLTHVPWLEMKGMFELMIRERKEVRVINSSWGLEILGTEGMELADFIKEYKGKGKPKIEYKYRQLNKIQKPKIERSLKQYKFWVKDALRVNKLKKYQRVVNRFVKEPMFNDILFVMMSIDYLEYQNFRNIIININKKSYKKTTSGTRHLFEKLHRNIEGLQNAIGSK